MTQPAFKGTLLLLQNRTRRDPDSYREEFKAQLEHFDAMTATITSAGQQQTNPQYIAVLNYVCHVAHCYPKDCEHVGEVLVRILRATKTSLNPETRMAFVKCLMLLRSKDLVSPDVTLPVLFELLQQRDKPLRKAILSHIVGDIRKANMPGAKNGAALNKKAQNFLFGVMAEDDAVQARCAMMVMIDLYRRMVWSDERTVQVLTTACFSKHTAILRTALRFLLMQMPKISSIDDESDHEEVDPGRTISKMKQKLKIVKKTKYRERVLDRRMKSTLRKYNKELKQEEEIAKQHVDPIRMIRDPHTFAEQLLQKLQRTSERFEIRILFLNVIARVVSEHEVVLLPLYSFLERYMEPSQLHSTQLLALSSMCVHRMVPPDPVEALLRAIANHFVNDRSSPDAITIGINTIREICKRQPLAMNPTLLADLVEYKNQRGDRGVMMAARALIQLYRDVQPDLLPAKLRAGKGGPGEKRGPLRFGAESPLSDIPGMELLLQTEQNGEDAAESSSGSDIEGLDDSDDDDSSDGSYELCSDSEDDVDGEFVTLSDAEEESDNEGDSDNESDNDEGDDCPQLVPAKPRGSAVARDDEVWVDDDEADSPRDVTKKKSASTPVPASNRAPAVVSSSSKKRPREEVEEEEADDSSSSGGWEEVEEGSDDEDDDEDDGEWEVASDDDEEEEEEGEDGEDSDDAEEDEEEGNDSAPPAPSSGNGKSEDWFVDTASEAPSTRSSNKTSTSVKSNVSVSAVRFLTDEDFEKIRKLQKQHGDHRSLRGKQKLQEQRQKQRDRLIHGVSADLNAADIEQFTEKKRTVDKEEKIARAQDLRAASSKFEARKKKKAKLYATHGEHAKRGKLFQMTKRSQRVADKLKRSVEDRADRKKDMKKKDVKFRIKRGWKA